MIVIVVDVQDGAPVLSIITSLYDLTRGGTPLARSVRKSHGRKLGGA
jgi:hypothetical protein